MRRGLNVQSGFERIYPVQRGWFMIKLIEIWPNIDLLPFLDCHGKGGKLLCEGEPMRIFALSMGD